MPDVRVITARAHRLLPPIIDRIGKLYRDGKSCVLFVPEQFTLQAERELISRLQQNGLLTIEVLSPTRLRRRVLADIGSGEREALTPAGQQMAVSYALETCASQLKFYRASVSRRGFAQKLTALIADLKRGGWLPETLTNYAAALPDGMQKEKFEDLAVLYTAYHQTIEERLVDSDDENLFVTRHIHESCILKDQHVFTYGFDAMSEQIIMLLCAVASQCESLTVGLISDGMSAADQGIYLPIRQSIARFRKALEKRGIALSEIPLPVQQLRHAPAINYMDETLFAYPQHSYEGEQEDVLLSQFNSPFEEAVSVSRKILQLNEQGVNLERIAVLYPDQNGYPFAVSAAFSDSGLPFYTDEKLPALSHALVQFIIASLRAVADGFRSEDVLALMKTGYANISFDDACTLEAYVREYGINYHRWLSPFQKGDDIVRENAETLRQAVILPLLAAREAIVGAKDTAQSLQAVMSLLVAVNAYDILKQEEEALLDANLLVRAGQNSQIWQAILELFDQLYILSNGSRIPLKYIAERFERGFAAISLAALPPAANMLHAGMLGHYLSGEMDVVFLLGMNDGILTKRTESLLTEDERAQAQESTTTYLGMTEESRLAFARLDIKRAMTLPRKTLFLSYAKTDPAGNTLQPLDLVNDMQERLFEMIPDWIQPDNELPASSGQALSTLSDLLQKYADDGTYQLSALWKQRLAQLLSSQTTAASAFRLLRAAGYRVETMPLNPSTARMLFGDRTLSVSRLEDYAACPFRHFVSYGLLPEELKEWEITPIERGNFFHDSLQRFAQIASKNPRYPNISQDEVVKMTDMACEFLVEALQTGPMGDGSRNLAALDEARRVIHRACGAVTEHLAAGAFKLEKAEAKFGYPGNDSFPPVMLHLQDGTEITLHGKIDRIDSYTTPDAIYRRVVDYKSGSYATLDAAQLWHGMQLQLMLYLDAVTGNTGDAKPAGAFYFHLFDPFSKADDAPASVVEADLRKQLQMDGLALSDTHIFEAMDAGETPVCIPPAFTASGAARKNAKVLNETQLNALLSHTKTKAVQFAQEILAGDIDIYPVKHGGRASCDYCDYRTICGYDPLARGTKEKEIPAMSMEELSDRLDGETHHEA